MTRVQQLMAKAKEDFQNLRYKRLNKSQIQSACSKIFERIRAQVDEDESRPPPKERIGERPGETPSSISFTPGKVTYGYDTPEKPRSEPVEAGGKTQASKTSTSAKQAPESDFDRIADAMVKAWSLPHRPTLSAMLMHLEKIGFPIYLSSEDDFVELATEDIERVRFGDYARGIAKSMHDSKRVRENIERQARLDAAHKRRVREANMRRIKSLTPEQRDAELESHLKGGSDPRQVVMPSGIIVRDHSPRK